MAPTRGDISRIEQKLDGLIERLTAVELKYERLSSDFRGHERWAEEKFSQVTKRRL